MSYKRTTCFVSRNLMVLQCQDLYEQSLNEDVFFIVSYGESGSV
jgi:hypothetical protein